MNSTTVTAILSLAEALLPILETGAVTIYNDIKQLLADAQNSGAATPDQITQAQQLDAASDAALDAAHAAYDALKASQANPST
jgi:hypothetical protein